jgi:hypothetical protein
LLGVVAALYLLVASPAGAFDLFATHEVTAQFATPDGNGEQQSQNWLSPVLVIGFLVVMLALAIWYRLLRARVLGRRS